MTTLSNDDKWARTFDVTEPTKHKKGYTVYKVISKVFPKNSIEAVTQVVVWKRYNDFKKLHKALSSIHQNLHLKGNFPKFAEARFFGRFAEDVIEERRKSALCLLEFAAQHSPLFTSQVFLKFFEGAEHLNPSTQWEQPNEKILAPVKCHPVISSQQLTDRSDDKNEEADTTNLLGGIWEHCQSTDEISLSSQASDNDDRTTFTDDSVEGTPLSSGDLALFDPLLERKSNLLAVEDGNDSWLLSAIQSCTYTHHNDETTSAGLFVPRPFVELEDTEPSGKENAFKCETVDTFVPDAIADLQEFDPLLDCQIEVDGKNSPDLLSGSLQSPLSCTENTYLCEAANIISKAQEYEAAGDFVSSFGYYKAAIGILLQGVQGETNSTQRDAVRRKTAQYLLRAEEIYGKHVCDQLKDANRWANESRLSAPSALEVNIGSLRGSLNELENYKVLGVIGHVLLVLDFTTNNTYVIKTLYKRPDPKNSNLPNIVPQDIPYMVQLYKVYETDYAIFLLLQHASGGRLWDYVNSYLQRSPTSPCMDCGVSVANYGNEKPDQIAKDNVYSGKKLCDHQFKGNSGNDTAPDSDYCVSTSNHSSIDSDLEAAPVCPFSYTALFTKYAASVDSDRVVLAKCNIKFQADDDSDDNCVEVDCSGAVNENHKVFPSNEVPKSIHLNLDSEYNSVISANRALSNDTSVPSSNDDAVELLISNSRMLLHNVDETLKATANYQKSKDTNMHCDLKHCEDLLSGNKEEKPREDGNYAQDIINFAKQKFHHSNSNFIAAHNVECLSSSTGTLSSNRIRHLSEVFQHLTTATSSHPYLPESCIRIWIAELVTALSHLHSFGLFWQDLHPDNILLGERGHILLTYHSSWNCMDPIINIQAKESMYAAPEVGGIDSVTSASDWWSVGALMFELLTGRTLQSCHPGGITAHSPLNIPAHISPEARDLLSKLLKYNVSERLGSGSHCVEDIKSHPFFGGYNWNKGDA